MALAEQMYGRPYVLPAMTVAALGAGATIELADDAGESDGLAAFDPGFTADVIAHRTPVVTEIARALTFLGDIPVLAALTVLVAVFLWWRSRSWRTPGLLLVAMTGSAALTYGLKMAVGRQRPQASLVIGTVDTGYSFPSGHTLNSLVFLGIVAALAWASTRSTTMRIAVGSTAAVLAAGVAASRVYLGYHWLTDVLAGWLIGLTWLCVIGTAYLVRFRAPRES